MLESSRIIFRPITRDDLPWLIEMRTREAVARYLGGSRLQNADALTKRMEFYLDCHKRLGFGICVMIDKETGDPIGTSGLQPLEDTGEIELGYNFTEDYWGKGLGTECARAWLRYGFEQLGLERIVAIAIPENEASWRIMEKCGMTYERTEEHYGSECVFYAVTRNNWLAQNQVGS